MSPKPKKKQKKQTTVKNAVRSVSLEEMLDIGIETKYKDVPKHLTVIPAYENSFEESYRKFRYYKSPTNIIHTINYFIDNRKGEPEYNPNRAGGINCSSDPSKAIEQIFAAMDKYNTKKGRYLYHYIIQCKLFNTAPLDDIHRIIRCAMSVFNDEYMIYYYIHGKRNKHNMHVHVSIFPTNLYTGKKLHFSNSEFYHLKDDLNLAVDPVIRRMKKNKKHSKRNKRK